MFRNVVASSQFLVRNLFRATVLLAFISGCSGGQGLYVHPDIYRDIRPDAAACGAQFDSSGSIVPQIGQGNLGSCLEAAGYEYIAIGPRTRLDYVRPGVEINRTQIDADVLRCGGKRRGSDIVVTWASYQPIGQCMADKGYKLMHASNGRLNGYRVILE